MNQLTGEFKNTLDEKGRLSLPSRMRGALSETGLVLTRGVDTCLWLFPSQQWADFSQKLLAVTSPFQAKSRLVQRRILAPAIELELDRLGRISIPQSLRESAGLSRECVILGISKYIEIWSTEEYRKYLDEHEAEFLDAAETLGDLTL
ncbi:MAG: division/cell wall cluster transcriptional repressor MraZ [Spirochaetes bacterium]|nr:division/cell wall cluster transcriptional repressor MraZ [Spirochaetota bacterium]